eukprot:11600962-Ditylum_brightwellii.AAC.1
MHTVADNRTEYTLGVPPEWWYLCYLQVAMTRCKDQLCEKRLVECCDYEEQMMPCGMAFFEEDIGNTAEVPIGGWSAKNTFVKSLELISAPMYLRPIVTLPFASKASANLMLLWDLCGKG